MHRGLTVQFVLLKKKSKTSAHTCLLEIFKLTIGMRNIADTVNKKLLRVKVFGDFDCDTNVVEHPRS